jgi:hypothetical protein
VSSGRSALPILVFSTLLAACGARSAVDCQGESCRAAAEDSFDERDPGLPDGVGPDGSELPDGVLSPDEVPPFGVDRPLSPEQLPNGTPIDRPIASAPVPSDGRICTENGTLIGSFSVSDRSQLEALEGCAIVDGDLSISDLVESDLAPLHELRQVTGTLSISMIGSLDGLDSLNSVGTLVLSRFNLPTLEPLSSVRRLGGLAGASLTVMLGAGLTNLRGLEGMAPTEIAISGNGSLESLVGLNVPGRVDGIVIQHNPVLRDMAALLPIQEARIIRLEDNAFTNLAGLQNLRTVESLVLLNSPALTSAGQLSRLETADVLYLDNLGIVNLSGLGSLRALNTAVIQSNANLSDIDALGALASLTELSVLDNPVLGRLPEFAAVTQVQQVVVRDNPLLVDGPLFPNAASVEIVSVSQNASLTRLLGFSSVTQARTIDITGNASLIEVNLGALLDARRLEISCNPALPESSLEPLRGLDAQVQIWGNLGSTSPCG